MSEELKAQIRERYAKAAQAAGTGSACCGSVGSNCCGASDANPISGNLYETLQLAEVPSAAVLASLGCGNPTALAELLPGEVVLDLGSGGGIDVLLSARRVAPTGKAYGLDMTDAMLALAEENKRQSGLTNVEFLKGDIEEIPLPENHVDVIISNCVVNLATDKDQVFRSAFRTLKPGGRLAISDIVFQGDLSRLPAGVRESVDAWAGCIAGALQEEDYLSRLQAAGFIDASIEVTRVYADSDLLQSYGQGLPSGIRMVSGFVRARKPAAGPVTQSA